jgi:hypothetical protein
MIHILPKKDSLPLNIPKQLLLSMAMHPVTSMYFIHLFYPPNFALAQYEIAPIGV